MDFVKEVVVPSAYLGPKLAPYNPTNTDAIEIALDMLELNENDMVYDLGCGDGRFMIQACMRSSTIQAVGVEYDGKLCATARDRLSAVEFEGLSERVQIVHANVLNVKIVDATKLFIYLVPEGMRALASTLIDLLLSKEGIRIVTYVFSIPGLIPQKVVLYKGSTKLYLYTKDSINIVEENSSIITICASLTPETP
jgi:SAM-dependent methyltransferase